MLGTSFDLSEGRDGLKALPNYDRFPMLRDAWVVAVELVDDRGELSGDVKQSASRFLKRKSCLGLHSADCRQAFEAAVGVAVRQQHFDEPDAD